MTRSSARLGLVASLRGAALGLTAHPAEPQATAKPAPTQWPTTEFVVRPHSPHLVDQVPEAVGIVANGGLSESEKLRLSLWVSFIRRSLSEIARYYEANGFMEPTMETSLVGPEAYIIYLYDFDKGWVSDDEELASGLYMSGLCSRASALSPTKTTDLSILGPALSIDESPFLDQDITAVSQESIHTLYQTLAHELLHAIQATYDRKFSSLVYCNDAPHNGLTAVVEGTAHAAASLATEAKYPGYINGLPWTDSEVGALSYYAYEFLAVESNLKAPTLFQRALAYKTSSFWRYLAERFGGISVFRILMSEPLEAAPDVTLEGRYGWLDRVVEKISGEHLYTVFPEFAAEFGSYVPARYKGNRNGWLRNVLHDDQLCPQVDVGNEDGASWSVEFASPGTGTYALNKNSAICIELLWHDIREPFRIEVQASYPDEALLDQLHLGVADLLTDSETDRCYAAILARIIAGMGARRDLECDFGKLFVKEYPDGRVSKTWFLGEAAQGTSGGDFFARKLGDSGIAFLVLTNMAPDPFQTETVPQTATDQRPLTLTFSIDRFASADGRQFLPPEIQKVIAPGSLTDPVPSMVDRYAFYGLVRREPLRIPGTISAFGIESVDGSTRYSVMPMSSTGYQFGQVGPLFGNVFNGQGAMSGLCDTRGTPRPIGRIEKSSEEQLRISVDTDLCEVRPGGSIARVDHVAGQFFLPFGRRYYSELTPRDIVTPGLELYIDEYLKHARDAGLPIPPTVHFADGSPVLGSAGAPSSGGAGSAGTGLMGGVVPAKCDCSCKAFKELEALARSFKKGAGPADTAVLKKAGMCMQQCLPSFAHCQR